MVAQRQDDNDEPCIEVYRSSTNWRQERYTGDTTVPLTVRNIQLSLADVYEGVF